MGNSENTWAITRFPHCYLSQASVILHITGIVTYSKYIYFMATSVDTAPLPNNGMGKKKKKNEAEQ